MSAQPELTYSSYLRLGDLLAQQHPRSSPAAHDELMFIIVHQTYELWFKLLLVELGEARDQMLAGGACAALAGLRRCCVIDRMLPEQFSVLDTMAAADFGRFRGALGTASGAQSAQFVELEYLSGLREPDRRQDSGQFTEDERVRLRRRLVEPSLWDGYIAVLGKAGFDMLSRERRLESCLEIAGNRQHYSVLWDLTEALIEHDQAWSMWRARHVLAAERQIGAKRGTGGSTGMAHLRAERSFYPELWEARTLL